MHENEKSLVNYTDTLSYVFNIVLLTGGALHKTRPSLQPLRKATKHSGAFTYLCNSPAVFIMKEGRAGTAKHLP